MISGNFSATDSPSMTVAHNPLQERQPEGIARVGEALTDSQREECITLAGKTIERHMALREEALLEYDITGDFGAKGIADRHFLMARYAQRLKDDLLEFRASEAAA